MDIRKPYVAKILENGKSKWIVQFFFAKTVWKCSLLTDDPRPKIMFRCEEEKLEVGVIRTITALWEITPIDEEVTIEWIKA